MRKLLLSIALGLSLTLVGCETAEKYQFKNPEELVSPQQKVQFAIDNANIAITSAARTVQRDLKKNLMTKDTAAGYFAKLVDASIKIDEAQKLLDKLDFVASKDKLKSA